MVAVECPEDSDWNVAYNSQFKATSFIWAQSEAPEPKVEWRQRWEEYQ
jgi:hypothetical protein